MVKRCSVDTSTHLGFICLFVFLSVLFCFFDMAHLSVARTVQTKENTRTWLQVQIKTPGVAVVFPAVTRQIGSDFLSPIKKSPFYRAMRSLCGSEYSRLRVFKAKKR